MTELDRKLTGKLPVLPPVIGERPTPLDPALVASLGSFDTSDLADLVGRLYTFDPGLRSLAGPTGFVGTAVTVRTARGDNRAVKQAVAELTPGDVLVVDAQGFTEWCVGGWNMVQGAVEEGRLVALVVDGAYRDAADFTAAGIPLYGRATSPATGPKLQPGEINVPAACGGVVVHPGDVLVADLDGIVVVPARVAVDVEAEAVRRRSS